MLGWEKKLVRMRVFFSLGQKKRHCIPNNRIKNLMVKCAQISMAKRALVSHSAGGGGLSRSVRRAAKISCSVLHGIGGPSCTTSTAAAHSTPRCSPTTSRDQHLSHMHTLLQRAMSQPNVTHRTATQPHPHNPPPWLNMSLTSGGVSLPEVSQPGFRDAHHGHQRLVRQGEPQLVGAEEGLIQGKGGLRNCLRSRRGRGQGDALACLDSGVVRGGLLSLAGAKRSPKNLWQLKSAQGAILGIFLSQNFCQMQCN